MSSICVQCNICKYRYQWDAVDCCRCGSKDITLVYLPDDEIGTGVTNDSIMPDPELQNALFITEITMDDMKEESND